MKIKIGPLEAEITEEELNFLLDLMNQAPRIMVYKQARSCFGKLQELSEKRKGTKDEPKTT